MKDFIHPLNLGDLHLQTNVIHAPLAGCSDLPYRKMIRFYHKGLMFCEMVKMDALVRFDEKTFRLLEYTQDMHPIGAQICGSQPQLAGKSARMIEELGFDVVDLNCGCPVDKVTKDGSGSGLLRNPQKIGEIVANMVAAVKIPVTVKIRAGWDEDSRNGVEITRIVEQAGAKAITVHGRTRQQGYQGFADRSYIADCKKEANHILVIGNGDIFDRESAQGMFETTGCDGILIARGGMGKPWLGSQIESIDNQKITNQDLIQAFKQHFSTICEYRDDGRALLEIRRVGCWYLRNQEGVSALRSEVSHAKDLSTIRRVVEAL